MKNHFLVIISALIYFTSACGTTPGNTGISDSSSNTNPSTESLTPANAQTPVTEKKFEGKGITYIVREDKSLGISVSRITILATDTKYTDSLNLGDKDPVQTGMLADLDENSHDELYLVTRSVGSGTYAHIFGFMRDEQNKLVAIEVPEISPEDQIKGKLFEGYMGHDTIYIQKNRLVRKFPKYNPGDANDKPTGGNGVIRYSLVGTTLEPGK